MHATLLGTPITVLPQDLYIPPDALCIFLETFNGPLDLLLYLIKKQNLNILDIPIAKITIQYIEYINLMQEFHLELAAEYLVMAAMLAEIKSRLLLPATKEAETNQEDPRAELVRKLQQYEHYKKIAENLDTIPRVEREIFLANSEAPFLKTATSILPEVKLDQLVLAFKNALAKAKLFEHHSVKREFLSVRERMTQILQQIQNDQFLTFEKLFNIEEGRIGVIVSFMAILELIKQASIEVIQNEPFAPIHIRNNEGMKE